MLSDSASIVGEELAYFIVHLTKQLRQLGHQVATIDMQDLDSFDKIFFLDYPTSFNSYFRRLRRRRHPELHLILIEPPIIRPDNYDLRKHRPFKTVLTWKKDGKEYQETALLLVHSDRVYILRSDSTTDWVVPRVGEPVRSSCSRRRSSPTTRE